MNSASELNYRTTSVVLVGRAALVDQNLGIYSGKKETNKK